MPDPAKKNLLIKKMRIAEVSLAHAPMNEFEFLIIKEKGGQMNQVLRLVASLSMTSKEVPEAFKEELKQFAADKLTAEDFLTVMKELGINVPTTIPEGQILIKKEDVVDKDKFDIVPKGTWQDKVKDPYEGLSPEIKERLNKQDETIAQLQTEKELGSLTNLLGEEVAKEIQPMKLSKEHQQTIITRILGYQKAIKDLGAMHSAPNQEKELQKEQARIDKEVEILAKERGLPLNLAFVEWCKEHPNEAAKMK